MEYVEQKYKAGSEEGKVELFMKTFNQKTSYYPVEPDDASKVLRLNMILEEVIECGDGMGCALEVMPGVFVTVRDMEIVGLNKNQPQGSDFKPRFVRIPEVPVNRIEVADGFTDIVYLAKGGHLNWGFPSQTLFSAVQSSNMSKAGPDGKPIFNAAGKVMKGPNYFKPDIAGILASADRELLY